MQPSYDSSRTADYALLNLSLNRKLPAKCHVVHMGVVIPSKLSSNERDSRKHFTIMCPANLLPVKGHKYLLQAVAELKTRGVSCRLLLAGHGPLVSSLERQVDEFKIQDRVKFLGQLSHNALLQYYAGDAVDAVVLPSVDLGNGLHEGIPVSLMEAMAYHIPVIATATGGIPELITEGTGILVPPQDSSTLADALERLVRDAGLRRKLALAGHQRVEDAFNIGRVVERLCSLMAGPAE